MPDISLTATWFVAGASLVVLVFLLVGRQRNQVDERLADLSAGGRGSSAKAPTGGGTLGGGGIVAVEDPLRETVRRRLRQEQKKKDVQTRMRQAGFYGRGAAAAFKVLRLALFAAPIGFGFLAGSAGIISMNQGIAFGAIAGLAGTLAPSFWIDHIKRKRQTQIRRALPDALDVLTVCLQGGLSLTGAFARVGRELATAHPMLAVEFQIIERQTQMGRTTGEAVREFADRFDLEELRSMAGVITQAERIGSSVVDAMAVFADSLRVKRHQRAEEMAQKAVIKIIFPTLLCIFPAIFIVILGPAAIQIMRFLSEMTRNL